MAPFNRTTSAAVSDRYGAVYRTMPPTIAPITYYHNPNNADSPWVYLMAKSIVPYLGLRLNPKRTASMKVKHVLHCEALLGLCKNTLGPAGRRWATRSYSFKGMDVCVLSGPRTEVAVQSLTDPANDLLHASLSCHEPGH